MPGRRPRTSLASSLERPSTSRSNTTSRCRDGSRSSAVRSAGAIESATSRSSMSSSQATTGWTHWPKESKNEGSTEGARWGARRCSPEWAERTRLTKIRNSHVFNDDRASKRSIPFTTLIHVSWTASSATASLSTIDLANRSIGIWYWRTNMTKASSSPSRRRATSSPSDSMRRIVGLISSSTSARSARSGALGASYLGPDEKPSPFVCRVEEAVTPTFQNSRVTRGTFSRTVSTAS